MEIQALDAGTSAAAPRYAGFWIRAVASVIDGLLINVAVLILAALLPGVGEEGQLTALETLVMVIGGWLYNTLCESSEWQATIGKRLLGLYVTDEQGGRIGFGRANGRYWSKLLSMLILCIGYLMVAFTQRKQGLHDLIARTLVLRR